MAVAILSLVSSAQVDAQAGAKAEPLTPFARQKAERLLRESLGCLGCHRLGNEGGVIAPPLHDVATRRDPAYIAAMVTDPARVRPGAAMPRAQLSASDRTLVIRYLGGDPNAEYRVATPPVRRDTAAAAMYALWCASCHGTTGKGDGPNATHLPIVPARHADATAMAQRSDDALYDTIHGGGAIMNRSARMPAFGGSLSATEVRALVRYIRTLCKCEGPGWSRGEGQGGQVAGNVVSRGVPE